MRNEGDPDDPALLAWLAEASKNDTFFKDTTKKAKAALPAEPGNVLVYTAAQTMAKLQISYTTLWRYEITGQLIPLPGTRHKRYPVGWVERFASGQPPDPAMARLWTLKALPTPKKARKKRSA